MRGKGRNARGKGRNVRGERYKAEGKKVFVSVTQTNYDVTSEVQGLGSLLNVMLDC